MILGIGTDIVSIARIDEALRAHGERFAQRVCTTTECAEMPNAESRMQWLAKRWAMKEAFAKACGIGVRAPLTWHAMQIWHDDHGAPRMQLNDAAALWLRGRGASRWHISVSDEKHYAVAFAVIEA